MLTERNKGLRSLFYDRPDVGENNAPPVSAVFGPAARQQGYTVKEVVKEQTSSDLGLEGSGKYYIQEWQDEVAWWKVYMVHGDRYQIVFDKLPPRQKAGEKFRVADPLKLTGVVFYGPHPVRLISHQIVGSCA